MDGRAAINETAFCRLLGILVLGSTLRIDLSDLGDRASRGLEYILAVLPHYFSLLKTRTGPHRMRPAKHSLLNLLSLPSSSFFPSFLAHDHR